MPGVSLVEARNILGNDLIEASELSSVIGEPTAAATSRDIPFSRETLSSAGRQGCVLLYRPDSLHDGQSLTLVTLFERCRAAADPVLRFTSDDPWFCKDRFAREETLEPGWALFAKEPWPATINVTYSEGDRSLEHGAGGLAWRRRRAVEIAFDCLAVAAARGIRLLPSHWDWSSSASADGGRVNVGGFGDAGLEVLAYSAAVKHGRLGICPTLVAR
jgi:hypothetical protein